MSWAVHDRERPQPKVVGPGPAGPPVPPPADAVVLFDGKDLSALDGRRRAGRPRWKVENGYLGGRAQERRHPDRRRLRRLPAPRRVDGPAAGQGRRTRTAATAASS
ncbi:MAG: hypothetical protein MZV64_67940 [Ignavibacteriales bacterium]|nr:hypothetical protein [Ignavibacteriales bacterium]